MSQSIIKASEEYVLAMLRDHLTENHLFHDVQHTLDVRNAVLEIGQKMGISKEETSILELSALFHDLGYTRVYDGHELVSQEMATQFLKDKGLDEATLQSVLACIAATKFDQTPQNLLEEIICDADLSGLGHISYFEKQANLRREWELYRNEIYSDKEWRKLNLQFFKEHQFHTQAARDLYGSQKTSNLALMKDSKKPKNKAPKEKAPLASSKSVQVMFKTALRNHIDLTNLADNKANIMLSINAIIITITIPLLSGYLEQDRSLIFPSAILLLTCIVSVIFATLATRPISMNGTTSLEKVRAGKGNLFFFGNFYKMSIEEYKEGMKEVMNDEAILEDSAISDLYYLGSALGSKYKLLRTCYTIFMMGMTLTVIAFAIARCF